MNRRLLLRIFLPLSLLGVAAQSYLAQTVPVLVKQVPLSYAEKKTLDAFAGLDFAAVEASLGSRLPARESVALAPEIASQEFFAQRFAETLYPRRIEAAAPFTISPRAGTPLAPLGLNHPLFLAGPAVPAPAAFTPSVAEPTLPALAGQTLVLILASFGLGALGLRALRFSGAPLLAAAWIVGTATTITTIAQIPLPHWLGPALGLPGLLLLHRARPILPRAPGAWGLAALVALSAVAGILLPVGDWDARSIWFFRAKEIFFGGTFRLADVLAPAYAWSYSNHPLLLPAWIAHFNALAGDSFSERLGTTSLWTLAAALTAGLWRMLRARTPLAPVLAAIFFLGLSPYLGNGAADGLLALSLAVGYLGLRAETREEIDTGWLALWCASLLKTEGCVLALAVALLTGKNRLRYLGFLPALAFFLWAHALSLPSDYSPLALPGGEFFPRTFEILTGFARFLGPSAFLAGGLVATAIALLRARPARPAILLAGFSLALTYAAFLLTRRELGWHIQTAMGRLLLHGAVFGWLAFGESTAGDFGSRRAKETAASPSPLAAKNRA